MLVRHKHLELLVSVVRLDGEEKPGIC